MWKKSDVRPNEKYRIQLCDNRGDRFFLLLEDGRDPSPECVFTTQLVPTRLLESRNFIRMSEEVRLLDGRRFIVDAHGVWLMESEAAAIRRGEDHRAIAWVTGVPPKRAPK